MKSHAQREIACIALFVALIAIGRCVFPNRIEVGEAILAGAATLLVQGLVRDLVRLRAARAR